MKRSSAYTVEIKKEQASKHVQDKNFANAFDKHRLKTYQKFRTLIFDGWNCGYFYFLLYPEFSLMLTMNNIFGLQKHYHDIDSYI